MYRISVVVFCALWTATCGGWLQDFAEKGVELSNGISFHVDEIQNKNLSLIERHLLRMDFAGIGVSVFKIPDENTLEIDVYNGNEEQGRGKKMGEMTIPIFIGFKVMAVGALMLAAVGSLVLQSLAAAKLSLVLSTVLAISNLFGKSSHSKHAPHKPYIRYQEFPPISTTIYDIPSHQVAGIPEYNALSSVGFDGYANYPSSVHDIASSRTQAAVAAADALEVNKKQQVINLNEQPAGLHRSQYAKRTFNDISYKSKGNKKYT